MRAAALEEKAEAEEIMGPARRAASLLARIERRELYKFAGGAVLGASAETSGRPGAGRKQGAGRAAADLNEVLWRCKEKKTKDRSRGQEREIEKLQSA